MDKKLDIKNPRFELVSSTLKGYKEVQVIYNYNEENHKYFIFIKEGKKVNYLKEAKKIFNEDIKTGKVLKSIKGRTTNSHPWLIATASVLGVVAITLAGLFTWKALTNGGASTEKDYILTFESNGGDHVDTKKVKAGTIITEPTITKKDYTFSGWYEKSDFTGNPFDFNTEINNDYTFYAKWTSDSNYVTLVLDAGKNAIVEETDSSKYEYYVKKGTTFADAFKELKYRGANKEGEDFLYWTIDNKPISDDYVINSDVSLNAKYKAVRNDCITVTARSDDLILTLRNDTKFKVSDDGANWTDAPTTLKLNNAGDQIYLKRDLEEALPIDPAQQDRGHIIANKPHSVSGPIESLMNNKKTNLPQGSFAFCFSNNHRLVSAYNLNVSNVTLPDYCFNNFFGYCSSLISAPELKTETLSIGCYQAMFSNCLSLTKAPELKAEYLADLCYAGMFMRCSSLTTAPELKSNHLAKQCYAAMFQECTSLTEAPKLEADELKESCYSVMFAACRSLEKAPELKVKELATNCYAQMFWACSSLTEAPKLEADELVYGCYAGMFMDCVSLTSAPALEAQTLAANCYQMMFSGCSSLTEAPELKAEYLFDLCYQSMFEKCDSLSFVPTIGATSLANNCCWHMFANCKNLKIGETTQQSVSNKLFVCPETSSFVNAVGAMFMNAGGSFPDGENQGTPTTGMIYYIEQ